MRGHKTRLKVDEPRRTVGAHDDVAAPPEVEMHDASVMHLADKRLQLFKKLGRNARGRNLVERPSFNVFNGEHARAHADGMLRNPADALQPSDGNDFARNQNGGNELPHQP